MTTTIVNIGRGLSLTPVQVIHNLDDFGFDIQKAADAWIPRRHNLSITMFVRYIRQQNDAFICVTLEEAEKIRFHLNSNQ